MVKACDFLNIQYYIVLKDKLESFPHQLVLVVQIGTFTLESMLIKYLIRDGAIPIYIDGLIIAKACDFISMMCYVRSFY